MAVTIIVIGSQAMLAKIRQWLRKNRPDFSDIRDKRCKDLDEAEAFMVQPEHTGVLIAVDVDEKPVRKLLDKCGNRFEAVIYRPDDDFVLPMPSASLLGVRSLIVSHDDLMIGLRKALIRLDMRPIVSVRRIMQEDEFEKYFRLRYSVWSRLHYIPEDRRCVESEMEVDHLDTGAIHLGAFTRQDQLIGCARLVASFGQEIQEVKQIVTAVVEKQSNRCLKDNMKFPVGINHPFDVLAPFPGFRDYYRDLVRDQTPRAEVSRIIVHPEHRDKGLGEVVVDSLVVTAYEHGIEVLFLACLHKHQEFYKKSGFSAVDGEGMDCERFPGVGVPAIVMERRFQAFETSG